MVLEAVEPGRRVGIERLIEEGVVGHSTGYRSLADFRKVFPEYASPGDLWAEIRGWARSFDDVDSLVFEVGAAPAPAVLAS